MNYFLRYLQKVFTVDVRALALMRIGIGFILLLDLAIRATDLEAHYSNMGVLPLHVLFQFSWNPYFISLHTISGLWQVQAILFLIAAVFAVLLVVGYRTRLTTVVSWFLLLSLQNRNTLIGQGGDDLLRMLLFWAIFLPWGRFYSVDATRKPEENRVTTHFSAASVAYIVQILLVYICTAILKSSPEWRVDGTALYYALSLDQILMPVGKLIYQYPLLLKFLTLNTIYIELYLPFILLIPVFTPFFRVLFFIIMTGFHIGISLTLFVGLFYLINFVSFLGLLPPPVMEWFHRKVVPYFQNLGFRFKQFQFQVPSLIRVSGPAPLQPKTQKQLRIVREGFIAFALLYVIWWNVSGLPKTPAPLPPSMQWIGSVLRLDQHWGMFSPEVFKDDGWYILDGVTSSNQHIDINQDGQPLTYDKPESVLSIIKNDRWRKYGENYVFVNNSFMRPYFCNYRLRVWNESHRKAQQIKELQVIYMLERSQPDYKVSPPERWILCNCNGK